MPRLLPQDLCGGVFQGSEKRGREVGMGGLHYFQLVAAIIFQVLIRFLSETKYFRDVISLSPCNPVAYRTLCHLTGEESLGRWIYNLHRSYCRTRMHQIAKNTVLFQSHLPHCFPLSFLIPGYPEIAT